ncbi:hypothetical protein [Leuconostoc pseudomesenteroides]|uniref:hypothetical protein n=1 Tax=Leuconostoc pseudomesenteroides TaxID=33968 RepID=UPI0032DFD360
MSEHSDSVASMISYLKNMEHLQAQMISQVDMIDNQMVKLHGQYIKFNELGQETNHKPIIDLVNELNSIEAINYAQNIKELKYEIETSRQDLIPYQSYLKQLV